MKNKSKELNELKFSNKLYISESMSAGNHSLSIMVLQQRYQLMLTQQLNQSGEIHKVFHTEDLAALLKVDDLDSFLMNL